MNEPEIFVLGVPDGAGKSTTATAPLPEALHIDQFVNADLIAKGLSPFTPESSTFDADRKMHQRIRKMRRQRQSFGFKTTLATRSYVSFLKEAQESGYILHLAYILLSSYKLAQSHVAARVQQGGHDVPAETFERRYWRGLRDFFSLYQSLVNTWTSCDNSGAEMLVVAQGIRNSVPIVMDAKRLAHIERQARDAQ